MKYIYLLKFRFELRNVMNLEKWKRRELLFVSLIYFKYESRNKKMKVIKISKESILWKKLKKTCTNVKSAELAVEAVAECNRVRGAEILGAVFRPRYSRPAIRPACRGSLAAAILTED